MAIDRIANAEIAFVGYDTLFQSLSVGIPERIAYGACAVATKANAKLCIPHSKIAYFRYLTWVHKRISHDSVSVLNWAGWYMLILNEETALEQDEDERTQTLLALFLRSK